MSLRQRVHRQLDVEAWSGRSASPANICIMALILVSVIADVLATEPVVRQEIGTVLDALEWLVLVVFSVEYVLRLWVCTLNPKYACTWGRLRYVLSFYALLDLAAVLPSFFAIYGANFTWLRSARLFRLLKFARFGAFSLAFDTILEVFRSRAYELIVSAGVMIVLILLAATGVYLVESTQQPEAFGSIPRSLWWSVATLTTVGYGDVAPITPLGKTFAAIVSLSGIALVAIPTGILAASFGEVLDRRKAKTRKR